MVTVHGGFAEHIVAWESHVIPIPPGFLAGRKPQPLFCAGGTVFSALAKVKLEMRPRIWPCGRAGGLGHYGIQLEQTGKIIRHCHVDLLPAKLDAAGAVGADMAVSAQDATEWFKDFRHKPDVALVCADLG